MKKRMFSCLLAVVLFVCSVCPVVAIDIGEVDMTKGTTDWNDPACYVYNNKSGLPDKSLYQAAVVSCDENGDSFLTVGEAKTAKYFSNDYKSGDIVSLSGLENFTSLESLALPYQDISDISALKELTALVDVYLRGNHNLSDITALVNLNELKSLNISDTGITDITHLPISIQDLDISDTDIVDISRLADLTLLKNLIISYNIPDLTAIQNLSLESLELRYEYEGLRNIQDLSSSFSNLKSLTSLSLSGFVIDDFSAISCLSSLNSLYLKSNNYMRDITGISKLKNLKTLSMMAKYVTKLDELRGLPIETLELDKCSSSELGIVEDLPHLKYLYLSGSAIKFSDFGKGSSELEKLRLSGDIETLEGIDIFPNLTDLMLDSVYQLKTITGIETLSNLEYLRIALSPLTKVFGIEKLPNLTQLDLSWNRYLSSLPDMSKCTKLGEWYNGKYSLDLISLKNNAFSKEELESKLPQHLQALPEWNTWLEENTSDSSHRPLPPPDQETDIAYIVSPDTVIDETYISANIPKDSGIIKPTLKAESSPMNEVVSQEMQSKNCSFLKGFDISLFSDGVQVEEVPNGKEVIVSIYSPSFMKGRSYLIFRDNEDGTVTTITPIEVGDGFLKFKTNHFSLFAVGKMLGKYVMEIAPYHTERGTATFTIDSNVYQIGDSVEVLPGTPITLKSKPSEGYRFRRWVGAEEIFDRTMDNVTFHMPEHDLSVIAIFVEDINQTKPKMYSSATFFSNYWITAKAHEGGTITDAGQKRFDAGEDHTYTILPDEGYQIDRVLVDDLPVALSGNTYTFKNISEPYTIEAYFVKSEAEAPSENEAVVNPPTGDVWWKWVL